MPDFDIKCGRCYAPLTHRCGGPSLLDTIKRLYKFVPEGGTPRAVIAEGKKNGMWDDEEDGEGPVPFFSETFLYALLGKEDARTVLGLLQRLIEAAGIEAWKVEQQAGHELAKEEAVKKYNTYRQEAFRARAKRNDQRMCTCGHPYGVHHSTDISFKTRVCTKCKTKCSGYVPASDQDKLEVRLPEKDRAELGKLRVEIRDLQKDPDEACEERQRGNLIVERPYEEELKNKIEAILEEKL